MSHVSIGSGIETILGNITSLNEVYSGVPQELKKYPCACVVDMGWDNKLHDTAGNDRIYRFRIVIFVRNDDPSEAENLLRSLADDVVYELEHDVTLGGSCHHSTATTGQRQFGEREVPVTYLEIMIEAHKRYSR